MKIFLTTSFFLLTTHLFGQYLADTTASRLKISKVVRLIKGPNNQDLFTDHYDKEGRIVKSVSVDKYSKESTITTYIYENGLVTNETFKGYYKSKLVTYQMIAFTYDLNGRMVSKILYSDDKRIIKDTTIYSKYGDTTYSYSNDTMIYDATQNLKRVGAGNSFHIERLTVNFYKEGGDKLRQIVYSYRLRERCKNINRSGFKDSTGYTITEFFTTADTTVEKVTRWFCAQEKETEINKTVIISAGVTYKEDGNGTTTIHDKLNELGLITKRTIINRRGYNSKTERTITYNYYFDR